MNLNRVQIDKGRTLISHESESSSASKQSGTPVILNLFQNLDSRNPVILNLNRVQIDKVKTLKFHESESSSD